MVASDTAGTYILRHPTDATTSTDVVLFHPGGPGGLNTASPTYDAWLSEAAGIEDFIVAVPYAEDGNYQDEYTRSLDVHLAELPFDHHNLTIHDFADALDQ